MTSQDNQNRASEEPGQAASHRYRLMIRESHLDTFGHVNNATYLQLFEEARWDLITEGGYGIDTIQQTRLGPVVLEANVKFRREVKNRETVTIFTDLLEYPKKIGRLRQRLVRDRDDELACEAIFAIALWNIDARKLVLPTPLWSSAVGLATRPA